MAMLVLVGMMLELLWGRISLVVSIPMILDFDTDAVRILGSCQLVCIPRNCAVAHLHRKLIQLGIHFRKMHLGNTQLRLRETAKRAGQKT